MFQYVIYLFYHLVSEDKKLWTVFPKGYPADEQASYMPQDFETYDEAQKYANDLDCDYNIENLRRKLMESQKHPIKDPYMLARIFDYLLEKDYKMYAICYLILRTGAEIESVIGLRIKDISSGFFRADTEVTYTFEPAFSELLEIIAADRASDELLFLTQRGNPFSSKYFYERLHTFSVMLNSSTLLNSDFSVYTIIRTFLFDYFCRTNGQLPATRRKIFIYKKRLLNYLNITEEEYAQIKSGEYHYDSVYKILDQQNAITSIGIIPNQGEKLSEPLQSLMTAKSHIWDAIRTADESILSSADLEKADVLASQIQTLLNNFRI